MALDSLKGIKTALEIAADNRVHPTQVTEWKSQMLAGASKVFVQGRCREAQTTRGVDEIGLNSSLTNLDAAKCFSPRFHSSRAVLPRGALKKVAEALSKDALGPRGRLPAVRGSPGR